MNRILNEGIVLLSALATIAAGMVASIGTVQAEVNLLPARQVINNYVEAIGGKKAVMAVSQVTKTGTFELPATALSGGLKIRSKAPNLLSIEIDLENYGLVRTGYDGRFAWSLNPKAGPSVLDGKVRDQMIREADFYKVLHRSERYQSMETVARTDFQGDLCWKVKLVTGAGHEIFEYFNVETALLVGDEKISASRMVDTETEVVSIFSGYKKFGDLLWPMKIHQLIGEDIEQFFNFDSITYTGVEDSDFKLPDEIWRVLPKLGESK